MGYSLNTPAAMMQYVRQLAADAPLYVLNTSDVKHGTVENGTFIPGKFSKLSMSIRHDGELLELTVPATNAPFDLTSRDAPLTAIRTAGTFRDMLAKGYFQILTEDEALNLLGTPIVQDELRRLEGQADLRAKIGYANTEGITSGVEAVNTPVGSDAPKAIPRAAVTKVPEGPVAAAAVATDNPLVPFVTRFLAGKMDLKAASAALHDMAKHATVSEVASAMASVGQGAKEDQIRDVLTDVLVAKRSPAVKSPTATAVKKPLAGLKLPGRK